LLFEEKELRALVQQILLEDRDMPSPDEVARDTVIGAWVSTELIEWMAWCVSTLCNEAKRRPSKDERRPAVAYVDNDFMHRAWLHMMATGDSSSKGKSFADLKNEEPPWGMSSRPEDAPTQRFRQQFGERSELLQLDLDLPVPILRGTGYPIPPRSVEEEIRTLLPSDVLMLPFIFDGAKNAPRHYTLGFYVPRDNVLYFYNSQRPSQNAQSHQDVHASFWGGVTRIIFDNVYGRYASQQQQQQQRPAFRVVECLRRDMLSRGAPTHQ
jgi:hypothetical protein